MGTAAGRALLGWISDDVEELDAGCCGMAGSFGYGHYDVSMKIGERRLFPAVREHDGRNGGQWVQLPAPDPRRSERHGRVT